MSELKHIELFAGVGGFRTAIDLYCDTHNITSNCIGYSEKDKFAVKSYSVMYDTNDEIKIGDLSTYNDFNTLPDFDLLTGGFPCQPYSVLGKLTGLDDKRGDVVFDMLKLIGVKKPKYILLENVKNFYTFNKGEVYSEITNIIKEHGYYVSSDIFNTADYSLPQTRRRLFILAIRNDIENAKQVVDEFCELNVNIQFHTTANKCFKYANVLDVLDKKVDTKYYLSNKMKASVLSTGTKGYKCNPKINMIIARPVVATMAKMHRAHVDNYYSKDFINGSETGGVVINKSIRRLTPKEAFMLQGFPPTLANKLRSANISDTQLYRQAGNGVSINVVYAILDYIFNDIRL